MWKKPKIHIWGGYGSQLNALYLHFILGQFHPHKNFELVFHSSGVTFREPEVLSIIGNMGWTFVDDYKFSENLIQNHSKKFFVSLKSILSFFGFLSEARNLREIAKIKPWIRQIRGHYSDLEVHKRDLILFVETVLKFNVSELSERVSGDLLVCQYRLGDLVKLTDKSPISTQRIVDAIKEVCAVKNVNEIHVLTDSVLLARTALEGELDWEGEVHFECKAPADTLRAGILADYFIGTTSKISIWIAVVRYLVNKQTMTFMPKELSVTLGRKIPGIEISENFSFY